MMVFARLTAAVASFCTLLRVWRFCVSCSVCCMCSTSTVWLQEGIKKIALEGSIASTTWLSDQSDFNLLFYYGKHKVIDLNT